MIQRHRSELTQVAAATQKERDAAFARQHHDAVRTPEERTIRRHRGAVEAEVNGHREVVHFGLRSARRCEWSLLSRRQRVVAETRGGGSEAAVSRAERAAPCARFVRRWSCACIGSPRRYLRWSFCFWCDSGGQTLAALSHSSETGGARASQPTQIRKSMRRIGRAHGSWDLARTALPDRSGLFARMHAARRSARGPWNAYLENLPRGPHSSGSAGGAASFRGTDIVPYLE